MCLNHLLIGIDAISTFDFGGLNILRASRPVGALPPQSPFISYLILLHNLITFFISSLLRSTYHKFQVGGMTYNNIILTT
jgi:hypothetical protein